MFLFLEPLSHTMGTRKPMAAATRASVPPAPKSMRTRGGTMVAHPQRFAISRAVRGTPEPSNILLTRSTRPFLRVSSEV